MKYNDNEKENCSYQMVKHKLNKLQSFSDTLEEAFECWEYNELSFPINDLNGNLDENVDNTGNIDNEEINLNTITSNIPKRNRIGFFNGIGKQLRLNAGTSIDHLPVTAKENRCLLCRMNTTVICPTCNVHLCKNAYGNNVFSCFHKFHTQDYLQSEIRNGNTYKLDPTVAGLAKRSET
jgi:hypothetical protein